MVQKKFSGAAVSISAILLLINLYTYELCIYGFKTSPPLLAGMIIMLAMSVFLILRGYTYIHKDRIKKCIPLIIFGILYIIAGVQFRTPTYLLYGAIFTVQLPLFYCIVYRSMVEALAQKFAKYNAYIFGLSAISCVFLTSLSEKQYCGLTQNPNQWGGWLVLAFICTLYSFAIAKKKRHRYIFLIIAGTAIAHSIFTRSRTTLIALILIFLVFVMYLISQRKKIRDAFNILISGAIQVPIWFVLLTYNYVALKFLSDNGFDLGESTWNLRQQLLAATLRYEKGLGGEGNFTSGRWNIWQTYIEKLSLGGHDPANLDVGRSVALDAHNTFIQTGYQAGIIAGAILIIIVAVVGIYLLKTILTKGVNAYTFFCLGIFVSSIVYMMLASAFGPYNSLVMIGFWLFAVSRIFYKDN